MGRIVAGLLALSAIATCSAPPPSAAISCGPPTALVPYPTSPELTGAPVGPLLIRGPYPPGAKDATALGFVRGRPFKMIVLVAQSMDSDIALTGVRCSDGQPLRFYLNKGGSPWGLEPASTPVPDDVMASTGDLRAVLPRIDAAATSGSTGYNGYFLFPTAGAYRIEGVAGDRKVGQATLVVSAEPYPATRPEPSRDPVNLAFAPGEQELITRLQDAGVPVLAVAASTLEGLFGPDVAARLLRLDSGVIEAMFFPEGSIGEFAACAEARGGRYVYSLTWRGQTRVVDSSQLIWYIYASNDAIIQVYGDLQTAQRVADKIGTTGPVSPIQPSC